MYEMYKENKRIIILPIFAFLVGVLLVIFGMFGYSAWQMLGFTYIFLLTPFFILYGLFLEWVMKGFK